MTAVDQRVSIWAKLLGSALVLLVLLLNVFTVPYWQSLGWYPVLPSRHLHNNDLSYFLPLALNLIWGVTGLVLLLGKRPLKVVFQTSLAYNLLLLLAGFLLYFSLNGISPGRFHWLRIPLWLGLLFLLTHSLSVAVIRERAVPVRGWLKNAATTLYGLLLIFLLLDFGFIFVQQSHRYNGSLSSRAWFYRYYNLNDEGYRDRNYDWKQEAEPGREKSVHRVMVLGDSFVEGHGIEDPEDRFSNVLGKQVPDSVRVHNLGKGGSDVKDALHRLREYPLRPDFLIFSYYPNDMEDDCAAGGKEIARIPHMEDVPGPFRFLLKRSYLLNYVYWRFPHGSDLFNYRDYLQGCYQDGPVLRRHLSHLDALGAYADSLDVPIVFLVWPFLEDISGTRFAADPVVSHLQSQGRRVLDLGQWFADRPVESLLVNLNDPHANEAVNLEVGDSLVGVWNAMLSEKGL